MTIRTLKPTEALGALWEELVYTEARLLKDQDTADLAPPFAALLKRQSKVAAGQLGCWRAEIVAQAGVDAGNEALDETVSALDRALLHAEPDRSAPRYRRYFPRAASEIVRLGLESELAVVRQWPTSLKGEPEKDVKRIGKQLAKDIEAGDEVVAARRKAAAATADHRVRVILPFVEAVNEARQSTYGELLKRGQKAKRGKGWAEGFFRRGAGKESGAAAEPETPAPEEAPTPAPVQPG